MKFARILAGTALAALALTSPAPAQDASTVKLALIDGQSGPNGFIGESMRQHLQFFAERKNAAGGVLGGRKFDVVAFDNKFDPQETIVQLQKAIDAGARYVFHGNSSAVAGAIVDFLEKHNRRNPDKSVLYINFAALDPVLTNDKCSFWHFRFDADVNIRTAAITNQIQKDPSIKKVYLFNQDYSFGKAVRAAATQMLKDKRPDIQIVGDELIPLQKVTDFTPYIAKIRATGADAVISANWGNDLNQLVKTGGELGLPVKWFTYFANGEGGVTALGAAGVGRVFAVSEWHMNVPEATSEKMAEEFGKKFNRDLFFYRLNTVITMLAQSMDEAKTTDPKAVALKLETMAFKTPLGDTYVRAQDHQFYQPLYVSVMSDDVPKKLEKTPFGFKTVGMSAAKETEVPTTCKMQRP
ncbi:branched-chain amino acid ABC transporter substrate-binding protein [Reyranella sp.]|uniref:branched-chain amino acid ABC transporter substrate-binding protein n=1 Tax=Reyranella sp. TaxID=1929291 RepID=UPI0011FDCFDE|nr:branched-chain amino acid ABC transporter substrate-binding protein [Reyranella sp.]TAJ89938.1 MAG: branched-chain amino acid ABC transporter substrate-binding protein [Reyranella sp.]